MSPAQEYRWRRTVEWLRLQFPASSHVYVRRITLYDDGSCSYSDATASFFIKVNKKQGFSSQLDSLFHEWAHALSWWSGNPEDHSSEWGIAYARIYRTWLRWNYGKGEK